MLWMSLMILEIVTMTREYGGSDPILSDSSFMHIMRLQTVFKISLCLIRWMVITFIGYDELRAAVPEPFRVLVDVYRRG